MMWRETDDLSEILAALDNGRAVEVWVDVRTVWIPVVSDWRSWIADRSQWVAPWRFRIEVPDAPSLPPGVVVVDTKKAQAKDCPALVDAGWTVRWIELGDPVSDADLAAHADILPDEWFEVCPPEGER